jgi:hypothetical protein
MKYKTKNSMLTIAAISATGLAIGCKQRPPEELPNILWITSEDNSAFLPVVTGIPLPQHQISTNWPVKVFYIPMPIARMPSAHLPEIVLLQAFMPIPMAIFK